MAANSLVTGIIVARWLGAEDLGALSVLNVTVAVTAQIGSAGLHAANIFFIAQDYRHLRPATINGTLFALAGGGMLAFGLTLLATSEPTLFGNISPRLMAIALISIPFQIITLMGLNVILAVGRVGEFNFLDLASQSFVVINAVLALVLLRAGLWTLVSLNTASTIVVSLVIVWLIRHYAVNREDGSAWRPDVELFKRMVRYSFKFHLTWMATILIYRADLLIVNLYRGAAEAGVYAVASQGALLLMLLPNATGHLLIQRVASLRDVRGEFTCVVTRHIAFIMLIICLAAVPVSFIFPALYGDAFAEATIQLLILLPGVYLIGIQSVLVQHFAGTGSPAAVPLFWIASLLLNITLNFMFVPVFGARGAAVTSSVSYAVIFALITLLFLAKTGNTVSATFLLRQGELRGLFALARLGVSSRQA